MLLVHGQSQGEYLLKDPDSITGIRAWMQWHRMAPPLYTFVLANQCDSTVPKMAHLVSFCWIFPLALVRYVFVGILLAQGISFQWRSMRSPGNRCLGSSPVLIAVMVFAGQNRIRCRPNAGVGTPWNAQNISESSERSTMSWLAPSQGEWDVGPSL